MHAAVLTCSDGIIRPLNLRLAPWAGATAGASTGNRIEDLAAQLDRLFDAGHERVFERIEYLTIQRALERCSGNQVRTARLLGISRNVLRTHLKRFGLIGEGARTALLDEPADEPDPTPRLHPPVAQPGLSS